MNSNPTTAPIFELAMHRYPAVTRTDAMEPIVLLHGWGCDSRSWQPLLGYLQQLGDVIAIDLPGFGASAPVSVFDLESVLALIARHLPERAVLVGWSLGGMLAVALAARFPQKITRVITLAANLKFVASPDYPTAMLPSINRQFNQGFAADSHATLKRFGGLLAQGDANERSLLKSVRTHMAVGAVSHNWQQALELLAQIDNRECFAQLPQPGLHIFGAADALVPAAAAQAMRRINSRQQLEVLTGSAHALHWSQPEKVARLIRTFLLPEVLDKRKVAHSFSRAAHTYDSVANLQRDVGEQLIASLPTLTSACCVMDLGCGTGFFSDQLALQYPAAEVIGLDLAEGMLQYARDQRKGNIHWLCADAESLPLQSASVDVIFSSLAIQWCADLPGLLRELQRVLKPGGRLLFSTLGPATLCELKSAWQAVDGYVHVNRFQSASHVQTALATAGFTLNQWQAENRVLHYERLVELTRELKALGAHNMNRGQPGGLTGRHKLEALKAAYENFRGAQYLPATYEVFYAQASRELN